MGLLAADHIFEIPLELIDRAEDQPRTLFDDESIGKLAASLAEDGQINPVLLKELGNGRYKLVAGERRFRAAGINSWKSIRARLQREPMTDDAKLLLQLAENVHRQDLSPLDEGRAFKRLTDNGWTAENLAERIKQSARYVWQRLQFLDLSEECQAALNNRSITAGHAEVLCRLTLAEQAEALADCAARDLTVRGLRAYVDVRFRAKPQTSAPTTTPEPADAPGNPAPAVKATETPLLNEAQASEQLAADAKPVERRAELPSGPVADREQVNREKQTVDGNFEAAVRRRIVGKIARSANASKAGIEFIRQYMVRANGAFAASFPEDAKALRELFTSDTAFTTVEHLYKPFQILIATDLIRCCGGGAPVAHLERPKNLIELAELAGVDLGKCEDEEKAAIAGMAAKEAKKAAKTEPKKKSKLRREKPNSKAKAKKK